MGKTVVRTNMPYNNVAKTLRLAQQIIDKHHAHPDIIQYSDMVAFEADKNLAEQKWLKAQRLHAEAEALMGDAEQILGIRKGNYAPQENQLFKVMLRIRDELLVKYHDLPESLSTWGFNIVQTKYMPGPRAKKKTNESNS